MSKDILETDGNLIIGSMIFYGMFGVWIFRALVNKIMLIENSLIKFPLSALLLFLFIIGLIYFPLGVVDIKNYIKRMWHK